MPPALHQTVAELVDHLTRSDAVALWVEQAQDALMDGDQAAFDALCQQLDDYPAGARRLFVPAIRRSDLLHQAVVNEQVAMVRRLIPWSDLRLKDVEGQTALMRAVGVDSLEMVRALLPGSRTTDRDRDRRTALMHAIMNTHNVEPNNLIVAALWDEARLNDRDIQGNSLLHLAADASGAYVPVLVQHLDVNRTNNAKQTPLMHLIMSSDAKWHDAARNALCEACDPAQVDGDGLTAFLYAVDHHVLPVVDALWAVSDRHHTDRCHRNALHLVVRKGSRALVERLLNDGLDPHASRHGTTPFQASTLDGPQEVFETFLAQVPLASPDPQADLLEFVLKRATDNGWEPTHAVTWARFTQVLHRYDRATVVQRLDALFRSGSTEAATLRARLPAAYALHEQTLLDATMTSMDAPVTPAGPRTRL